MGKIKINNYRQLKDEQQKLRQMIRQQKEGIAEDYEYARPGIDAKSITKSAITAFIPNYTKRQLLVDGLQIAITAALTVFLKKKKVKKMGFVQGLIYNSILVYFIKNSDQLMNMMMGIFKKDKPEDTPELGDGIQHSPHLPYKQFRYKKRESDN